MEDLLKDNYLKISLPKRIDAVELLTGIILEPTLTKREMKILRYLVDSRTGQITDEVRKDICNDQNISRMNLNNVLIRMQLKGVFTRDWVVSRKLDVLYQDIKSLEVVATIK